MKYLSYEDTGVLLFENFNTFRFRCLQKNKYFSAAFIVKPKKEPEGKTSELTFNEVQQILIDNNTSNNEVFFKCFLIVYT